MNTSFHCVFDCVFLVHIQFQTLCHILCTHVVLSCCHVQIQWYMLHSLLHVKFHLQKSALKLSTLVYEQILCPLDC